jgi:hypothetical protein
MKHVDFPVVHWMTGVMLFNFFASGADLAANVRTVALSGHPAAGTSAGVAFSVFTEPVLDADGRAAFWAQLAGTGVNSLNNTGIWSEGSGNLELVARTGSQAPGMPSGINYDRFSGASVLTPIPRLNAAGQTAFRAYATTTNGLGMWAGDSGNLRLVAREGNQAPDAPGGVNFSYFSVPVLNAAGQTAFQVQLTGSGVNSSNDYGIWSEGSGTLRLVARAGDHAPGAPSGVNYSFVDAPVLNGAGRTAFWGLLTGSGVTQTNNQGIWIEREAGLELVARSGDAAPGTPIGVDFKFISTPNLNGAGQRAFIAGLTGAGVDATNDAGIWYDDAGELSLFVREGSQAPGTPDGVFFRSHDDPNEPGQSQPVFLRPSLNSAGRISFAATLAGAGVNDSNGAGVWSNASGSLELVARYGSHAAGTPDGVNFKSIDTYGGLAMNAAGQTAFKGFAGVDSLDFAGIWATDVNGILQLIVRTGVTLEVAPNDFRTINDLSFVASEETGTGNEDGRPSSFNDRGQLAFEAHFLDGSSGIFVSDAVLNDGALPGDLNKNNVVDDLDYLLWRKKYSTDQAGYNIWRANFGRTSTVSGAELVVPEPSPLRLLGLGVVCVLLSTSVTRRVAKNRR